MRGKLNLWQLGVAAILTGLAANAIAYFILSGAGMIPEEVLAPPKNEAIKLMSVMEDTAIGVLGAVLVFVGLTRFSKKPVQHFRWIALVLLILSFVYPPLLIDDLPLKMFVALNLMHVIAAGAAVWALTILPGRQISAD